MINNEELGLSNRSYLNKDFARIYEESHQRVIGGF